MAGSQLQNKVLSERRAGVLLHATSLPGRDGIGTLGADAYYFIDWMKKAALRVWQMLPLGPTHVDGSPYQCLSAHAGNPRLICTRAMVSEGWLDERDSGLGLSEITLFQNAEHRFQNVASADDRHAYEKFCKQHAAWLDDYALFIPLRERYGNVAWNEWPPALRDRMPDALIGARLELQAQISAIRFQQYVFFRQWSALKRYANDNGILILGDLPIFVAHDSADVWANRRQFLLDEHGRATVVAGVPPDYFSETGQRWGNPLYNWTVMQDDGFTWWHARFETQLAMCDMVRLDHFRGFQAYWEIPAHCPTAKEGRWVKAPGKALFRSIANKFGWLPLIAEDLGVITREVTSLRRQFHMPGMKILQFAFDGDSRNPYLPHAHTCDSVAYTGTHDNATTLGWFRDLAEDKKQYCLSYLASPREPMPWPLIRSALSSVSQLALIPMQDFLALDDIHRMNRPGTTEGNWKWRFDWSQVTPDIAERVRNLVYLYGRGA